MLHRAVFTELGLASIRTAKDIGQLHTNILRYEGKDNAGPPAGVGNLRVSPLRAKSPDGNAVSYLRVEPPGPTRNFDSTSPREASLFLSALLFAVNRCPFSTPLPSSGHFPVLQTLLCTSSVEYVSDPFHHVARETIHPLNLKRY